MNYSNLNLISKQYVNTKNASMKIKSETTATKIEENVSIPSEKFEVPKDVVMTER